VPRNFVFADTLAREMGFGKVCQSVILPDERNRAGRLRRVIFTLKCVVFTHTLGVKRAALDLVRYNLPGRYWRRPRESRSDVESPESPANAHLVRRIDNPWLLLPTSMACSAEDFEPILPSLDTPTATGGEADPSTSLSGPREYKNVTRESIWHTTELRTLPPDSLLLKDLHPDRSPFRGPSDRIAERKSRRRTKTPLKRPISPGGENGPVL
jgi:hypothetical protein